MVSFSQVRNSFRKLFQCSNYVLIEHGGAIVWAKHVWQLLVNALERLRIEMQSIASDLILMNINDGCVRLSIHFSRITALSDNLYAAENSWLVKVQSEPASLLHSATHSHPNPIHGGEFVAGAICCRSWPWNWRWIWQGLGVWLCQSASSVGLNSIIWKLNSWGIVGSKATISDLCEGGVFF